MMGFLRVFRGLNATPFPPQDRVRRRDCGVPQWTRSYFLPPTTMTKQKRTLSQRWHQHCAIARRVAFAPRDRPRRKEYCVSPYFDLVLIGLLIVLGLGLLL